MRLSSDWLFSSTLDVAYNAIISSMVNTAQDHMNFADALTVQTLDVLRTVARKNDETKKKVASGSSRLDGSLWNSLQEMAFFQKLLSDRDRVYSDRLKVFKIFFSLWRRLIFHLQCKQKVSGQGRDFLLYHSLLAVRWRMHGGRIVPAEAGKTSFLVADANLILFAAGTRQRWQACWSGCKTSGAPAERDVKL